jgi:hypothetical protein
MPQLGSSAGRSRQLLIARVYPVNVSKSTSRLY